MQNDQNSHYDWYSTNDMKSMAKFYRRLLKPTARGQIFSRSFLLASCCNILAKEVEVVQRSGESRSFLYDSDSRMMGLGLKYSVSNFI